MQAAQQRQLAGVQAEHEKQLSTRSIPARLVAELRDAAPHLLARMQAEHEKQLAGMQAEHEKQLEEVQAAAAAQQKLEGVHVALGAGKNV